MTLETTIADGFHRGETAVWNSGDRTRLELALECGEGGAFDDWGIPGSKVWCHAYPALDPSRARVTIERFGSRENAVGQQGHEE